MVKDEELESDIKIILSYIKSLNNPNRREILRQCIKTPKTISELKRILNSSNKVTYENIKYLEKENLVKLDKRMKEKHHPVYITSLMSPEEALLSIHALIEVRNRR